MKNISTAHKNLIIITEIYPYLGGEQFLYNEFIELSKLYKKIYFFPLNKGDEKLKNLPTNFILNDALNSKTKIKKSLLLKNFYFVLKTSISEIFKNKNGKYFFKNLRYNISTIRIALHNEQVLHDEIIKSNINVDNSTFMSAWMNIAALTLSVAKYKKHLKTFSFRVNGYDIFDERWENNYMPFQFTNYSYASNIIVLSKAGFDHIKLKNMYPKKLHVNYSGQYKLGENKLNNNFKFTIVSCARLVKLKRVDLIAKSLNFIPFEIKWTHFGDGEEMQKVIEICNNLPNNVEVDLKGDIPHKNIIDYYKSESYNLFVHVSETEGLGMATIEAQSFGIPAVACGVGGVMEVVTDKSGKILPENLTPEELANEIISFKNSNLTNNLLRKSSQHHFETHFEIESNVKKLINIIE